MHELRHQSVELLVTSQLAPGTSFKAVVRFLCAGARAAAGRCAGGLALARRCRFLVPRPLVLAPLTHGERGKMETIGTTAELEPDNQKAMDVEDQNKEYLP